VVGVREAHDAGTDDDHVIASLLIAHADTVVHVTPACQYKSGIFLTHIYKCPRFHSWS
jgi:hypothetical protein